MVRGENGKGRRKLVAAAAMIAAFATVSGCRSGLDQAGNIYPLPEASQTIATIRLIGESDEIDLTIHGAVVTYAKPQLGTDPPTLFLQAVPEGPAIAIGAHGMDLLDKRVGDAISIRVTETRMLQGRLHITDFTDFEVLERNVPFDHLVVDVSDAPDLVSHSIIWESRIVLVTGTVTGEAVSAGTGYQQMEFATQAVESSMLRLRAPTELLDALSLEPGCEVSAYGIPVWRFENVVQLNPHELDEIVSWECPVE